MRKIGLMVVVVGIAIAVMAAPNGYFKKNADGTIDVVATEGEFVNVTTSGTITGDITGDINATASASQEWGDGALSNGVGVISVSRRAENGTIITETKLDISGMVAAGNTAADAIGVAGDPCYIGRYVSATDGIVFKIEMICLEAAVGGDTDIDFGISTNGTIEVDGAVERVAINTATLAAGETAQTLIPTNTTGNYYYLLENGGTAATYTAGQFIIRTYGHPLVN